MKNMKRTSPAVLTRCLKEILCTGLLETLVQILKILNCYVKIFERFKRQVSKRKNSGNISPCGPLKARFKRRTSHVPNLMLMSKNNRFCSLALDLAHVKFDV